MQSLCANAVRTAVWNASNANHPRTPSVRASRDNTKVYDGNTTLTVTATLQSGARLTNVVEHAAVVSFARQYDAAARAAIGASTAAPLAGIDGPVGELACHAFRNVEVYDPAFRYEGNRLPCPGTRVLARLGFWFTPDDGTKLVLRAVKRLEHGTVANMV